MAKSAAVRDRAWLGVAITACGVLGAVDAFIPREAAVGVLYVPIVLLAMLARRAWGVMLVAGIGTVLAWLDFFISPDGGDVTWALLDRCVASVAIWTSAGLCAAILDKSKSMERSLRVETLLRRELDERVRHTLAFLRAMLALEAGDPSIGRDQLVSSLRTRIRGMEDVHDLLASQRWKPLWLRDLLRAVAPPAATNRNGGKLVATGPETMIPPGRVGGLGAVLHELVLHSTRGGALSVPGGTLEVKWDVRYDEHAGARVLELIWQEFDPPGVKNYPTPAGTADLLEPFVKEILGGDIEFAYPSSGAFHRLSVVLPDEPDLHSTTPPSAAAGGRAGGTERATSVQRLAGGLAASLERVHLTRSPVRIPVQR